MGRREEYVIKAQSWLGTKEKSAGHKKLVADYNKACDKGRSATISTPWCALFVGAVAEETDNVLKDGIGVPVDCSCGTGSHSLIEKAKKADIWVENDSYRPRIGDIIIYDWGDKGSGDDTSGHDHTGVVISIGSDSFLVCEGNRKSTVSTREMKINGRYIRGFITPIFADEVGPLPVPSGYSGEFPKLPSRGYFKKGDKGSEVVKLQNLLLWISAGCLPKYGADGDYGNETFNAVKVCQSILGVKTDGLWGKVSQAKAKAYKK